MKLQTEVSDLVLANVSTTGEFKIRNSAKAFKILSDGLYSNKIRAIVRELTCNAIDSHVAAGRPDVQVEVHLPTVFESWFSVRDYGTGLNHDEVTSIYTTYFESTKTESNDFIGALGLGSKSPFSYTENFTVIAIKDGFKRIYSAFINQQGVPSVALMSEDETTESNGVEVKFSVTNRNDYYTFESEAQSVFAWFKNIPKITGKNTTIHPIQYQEKDILPGIHRYRTHGQSMAIMGNIAYPIRLSQETARELGDVAKLLDCGLVLEFAIGELDFTASREELSYIPLTVNSIKTKLTQLNEFLEVHIEQESEKIACKWKRAEYFYSQWDDYLYSSAVRSYTKRVKFPYVSTDGHSYHGRHVFKIPEDDLDGIQILAFQHNHGTNSKLTPGKRYDHSASKYISTWEVSLSSRIVLVLNDLRVGCHARARANWVKRTDTDKHNQQVFCISLPEIKDEVERKKAVKAFQEKYFPDCPNIVWASSIPTPPAKPKAVLSGVLEYRKTEEGAPWTDSSISSTDDIDENQTYYYVNLSNFQPVSKDRQTILHTLDQTMNDLYYAFGGKLPFTLLGVRKGAEKEIRDLDNFVWFEDKIKEIVESVSEKDIRSAYAISSFDYRKSCFFEEVGKLPISKQSPIYLHAIKYADAIKVAKSSSSYGTAKATSLSRLTQQFGKSFSAEKVEKEIQQDIETIRTRYPMLQYVHINTYNYDAEDKKFIADYITLIDKQEK